MKGALLFIFFFSISILQAQVGIGTTEPGAQLDIVATNTDNPAKIDGILIPRIKKFPTTSPGSEQHGMLIFLSQNVNNNPAGFYYWHHQESKWKSIVADAKAENFHEKGETESPGNIDDPIFRKGNIGIGTDEINSKLQIAINPGEDLAIKKGIEIDNSNSANTQNTYGIEIRNRSQTNAMKYGIKNHVTGDGEGEHYGIHNVTNKSTGSSDLFGIYNRVGRTEGSNSENFGIYTEIGTSTGRGTIYGIYAKAEGNSSSDVYAGYFAGRVGIGSNPANDYALPDSRGTEGQVLMAEANGGVAWKNSGHKVYESTGGNSGPFRLQNHPEIYSLRITNSPSSIELPIASENRGRIIILIGFQGSGSTPLSFLNGDELTDLGTNTEITQIANGERLMIQSINTRWIVLFKQ